MSWFKKNTPEKVNAKVKKAVPDGVWTKCEMCHEFIYEEELSQNLNVCHLCGHHHYISAKGRLASFFDGKSDVISLAEEVLPQDPLQFNDGKSYRERLMASQQQTGESEALIVQKGLLFGQPVIAACFEFKFIGGSMSMAVGERFAQAAEAAIAAQCPFICFSASGGARMQEGMFSLLQMAKTSAVVGQLNQKKLPYISVLLHPTMGGVSASFATLGDIIIAEPKALIGFSGPRVIKETIRHVLPEGFQRSEFLLEHGAIDMIVQRDQMRPVIGSLLAKLMHYTPIESNI